MANSITSIKVQQPWEWSQEGQLRVSVTVTLPNYPANRNIMEDFCSFRSLDFGDVRILQLGIRRHEDATRQWLALVVGVRGRAQDGRDPYIEKEVREVHPGQHFHIDLLHPIPELAVPHGGEWAQSESMPTLQIAAWGQLSGSHQTHPNKCRQ